MNHSAVPPSSAPSPAGSAEPGTQESRRILLVDDDLINQKVLGNLIKRRGWQPVSVSNGQEALDLLARENFDLVFMDIQMPEMNGFETAAQIRRREQAQAPAPASQPRRVAIVALTTVSEPGTRERCLAAGMDDYLAKPVKPPELYEVIARCLNPRG